MIRVRYDTNKDDLVHAWMLDELIEANKIQAFRRATGWVVLGKDKVRGQGGAYSGPDRRLLRIPSPRKPSYEELEQRLKTLEKEPDRRKRAAVAPILQRRLGEVPGKLAFTDLFDLGKIQVIQDAFAKATHVASIITDPDGNPITQPSNFSRLCRDIIRKTSEGLADCFLSDFRMKWPGTDEPAIKTCMSGGLWDAGVGINVGDRHIANWLIGQVRDTLHDEEAMLAYAHEIGADEEEFRAAIADIPVMTKQQFADVSRALFLIANQMSELALQIVQQARTINERELVEQKLRESEERYRNVYNTAPLAFVVWDCDCRISDWNERAEEMFGWTRQEVLGRNFLDFLVPEAARTQVMDVVEALLQKKIPLSSVNENLTKSGKIILCEWNHSIQYDSEGRAEGALSLALDITERRQAVEEYKRLEARLRQAQKMEAIGTLAGGIAHDFNNILTAILGYAELARYDLKPASPAKANLDAVLKAGTRARELVKQILTFSRQADYELKPVWINLIAKETLKLLRASTPTSIEIRQKICADCRAVLADPTQVHQLLMNLCTNAVQSMKEKGVLEVSLAETRLYPGDVPKLPNLPAGDYLRLTVSDTGIGMDRKTIERIFDPFFTTKEVGRGTGMGLSVVHGIVEGLGGQITVDSKLGRGTTIQVFLPATSAEAIQAAEAALPLPGGNEQVLFVDDEKSIATMGRRMLERLGYKVFAKTGGLDALKAFQARPDAFDLVITDQTMPKMTGEELARELLKIRPDIPIILCTGYSSVINEEKAKAIGVREFAMKPIAITELARTIRRVLDNK